MPPIAGFRGVLTDPKQAGEPKRDPTRAMYRYHQSFAAGPRTLVRKSWYAAVALSPWSEHVIRPHETINAVERDAALADIARTNQHATAVLLGYRDAPNEVDRLFKKTENERPTFEQTTADGATHKLWRVQSAEVIGKLRPLFAPKRLHVLDGHARWEAMVAYRDQLAAKSPLAQYSSANYGLACLVNLEDPALATGARHRIVRGVTRDALFDKMKAYFIIEKLAGAAKDLTKQLASLADTVAHQPAFVALFAGDADAYKLTLSPEVSPAAEGVGIDRAIQKYDPVVVDQLFLAKGAPGATHETSLDPAAVIAAVGASGSAASGGNVLGLILRPLSVAQIAHADELGQLLPSGSTAFFPPIAPFVAYAIDPDEDVV
jgi:hypothetical protein